ncbi:MAG TPA: hypothetical protein VLJ37_04835 [bacterium]|nr:hypothetical protein [bacterium]
MKRLVSKLAGWMVAGMILGVSSQAHAALVCPDAHQPAGTAWCDGDASRFQADTLCVAEPVDGPPASSIDEEVVGAGVCINGKFKTADQLEQVADFVVSYDFPADPLLGPSGLFVPELETLAATGEFMTTVPLEDEGVFDIVIQGRVLTDDGAFTDVSIARRVLRVSKPHLTVTRARVGGATADCSASDPSCFGLHELEGDSDGDGICDGPVAIPNLCAAGPDTTDDNGPDGEPHTMEVTPPAVRSKTVELCVNSHDAEPPAGNSILVRAVNTITDDSVTPAKEVLVDASCAEAGSDVCQVSSDSFCPGGFRLTVPLGHGRNEIELFVNNLVTGSDIGAAQQISVVPFDVDLKGPDLCVRYLDEAGHAIDDVDGKSITADEAASVTVDVTLGACGGEEENVPETNPTSCDNSNPPACGTAAVCLQSNDEREGDNLDPKFVAMCKRTVDGKTHFQAAFPELRFPVNTATIKAVDALGNQTFETRAFGYGNVRPLFDAEKKFDLKAAMVDNGVGGFVKAGFVKDEVLPLLLKVVNSKKFVDDFFFQLMDPRQPSDQEISCLKSIEDDANCTFGHLASKERVVAIKTFCDADCSDEIGSIEIPSLYFLNQNRLRVQMKVKGFHGRAEMYTMRFIDSDNDSIVDTEDDDADNDGICDKELPAIGVCDDENHDGVCDKEISLTGTFGKGLNASRKCVLDKSVPRGSCPDVDAGDERYFGCSDQDDDNDGIPDSKDLPGRLVQDPDFATHVIPVKFTMKEMVLNLDVSFEKSADGRLHVGLTNAPDRKLMEFIADDKFPIEFDCDKDVSELYQGGYAGQEGNGRNLWIDSEVCRALENLNPVADQALFGEKPRKQQSTRKQLECTVEALVRCSIPKRLDATLDRFENDKVAPVSLTLLDNRFHMDFFAPLGSAGVTVDPRGLGFKGKGLLIPAGVSEKNDEAERDGKEFLNNLPEEFKTPKFGPLSKTGDDHMLDPIDAAQGMGNEVNLALNEETVNSALHSVGILLWELARQEGDAHQMLDLTATKLREDFDFGIPDIGSSVCKDKNGDEVAGDSYKCFPFPLNIENVLGPTTIQYVDFDGDGVPGTEHDALTPIMIRNNMNPFYPPTVRLVTASPIDVGGDGEGAPTAIMAELEIGLGDTLMTLFEEKVADWNAEVIKGTGEIKNWCDSDRFPGANQEECDASRMLPMVSFKVSGRVFVTLLVWVKDAGIIRAEGGLSSIIKADGGSPGEEMQLDKSKTYLEFSVLDNNTIVPDNEIASAMKTQVGLILEKYVFGNARDIRIKLPTQLPLEAYCEIYAEDDPDTCECVNDPNKEDCDLIHDLQDIWDGLDLEQYGFEGVRVDHPVLGITEDDLLPVRYLTIGTGLTFDLTE